MIKIKKCIPKIKKCIPDILASVGAANISIGAFLVNVPLGFLVTGVLLIAGAVIISKARIL